MISCIVLAAGLSRRFGSPKALAQIDGRTVIERLVSLLADSPLAEVIIVLGANKEQIEPFLLNHKKVKVVYNKHYNLGQTSSFQAGLKHISSQALGVMLFPVDYPAVSAQTIKRLIDEFNRIKPILLVPTYEGINGHPPVYSSQLLKNFLELDPSLGINTVNHSCAKETVYLSVNDPGVVKSFNTPEELKELKAYLTKRTAR